VCVGRIELPLSNVTNADNTVTTAGLPGKCYSSTLGKKRPLTNKYTLLIISVASDIEVIPRDMPEFSRKSYVSYAISLYISFLLHSLN